MSEYQYYEFLAIERPLSAQEMDHLRAISTRAQITPVSFINEYNWGQFKGSPTEFMRRFFDAHVFPCHQQEVRALGQLGDVHQRDRLAAGEKRIGQEQG